LVVLFVHPESINPTVATAAPASRNRIVFPSFSVLGPQAGILPRRRIDAPRPDEYARPRSHRRAAGAQGADMPTIRNLTALLLSAALAACASYGAANDSAHPSDRASTGLPVTGRTLGVRDNGALADGKTKDTAAFQKTLDACAAAGGGTVIVPAGDYLIGSIHIGANTRLHFEKGATLIGSPDVADYPVMKVRWEGEWRDGHSALITAHDVDNVAITGDGVIQGPPLALAALRPNANGNVRGPSIFEPIDVHNLTLDGFSVKYQRMWSIHMTYCSDVHVNNLNIRSSQANGDGIDVDSCKNVLIENCDIDAGDDAICLKSGRNMEAVRIARPTENVTIKNCKLGSSFAGLGIGTEMSGGVRNVSVSHCVFTRANGQNSIFIKSRTGRGGFMTDITFNDIECHARTIFAVDIVTKGVVGNEPVTGPDAIPTVKNISFTNVTAVDVPVLVDAKNIGLEKPVENITIKNLTGTARTGMTFANVKNLVLENIHPALTTPPLLTTTNTTGPNLDQYK
jgi:polygalacturonase